MRMTKVTVFDLDDTLLEGDSAQLWLEFLCEQNWPGAQTALLNCSAMMDDYYRGALDMQLYMQHWARPLLGASPCQLAPVLARFVSEVIEPRFFKQALTRLQVHLQQGDHTLVISASPAILVKAICDYLQVEHCIGIDLELLQGRFSGKALLPYSLGEGKVIRLRQWFKAQQLEAASQHLHTVYSDSINDVPLLQLSCQPQVVNPNPVLLDIASAKGWTVHRWQR
ncbi:HAD family hydrolase [Bowmanella denitrificans]|uniref:HAD family hydrolase n=1 Tax=Bowmanella denitrificans TaxID=366582 RepID=A0ABP3HAG6_9ALTE